MWHYNKLNITGLEAASFKKLNPIWRVFVGSVLFSHVPLKVELMGSLLLTGVTGVPIVIILHTYPLDQVVDTLFSTLWSSWWRGHREHAREQARTMVPISSEFSEVTRWVSFWHLLAHTASRECCWGTEQEQQDRNTAKFLIIYTAIGKSVEGTRIQTIQISILNTSHSQFKLFPSWPHPSSVAQPC